MVFPVTSVLRWDSATDETVSLRAAFEEGIEATVASDAFAETIGAGLARALGALPKPRLKEVLRSPQIVAQVIRWRRDGIPVDEALVSEAVLAELVLQGYISELPVSVWSVRGDVKVVPEDGVLRRYQTPWLIADRVAIDDGSLQTFPYDGESEKLLLPLGESDSKAVRERLAECMNKLSAAVSPAAQFTQTFLTQVSLRFEPGAPRQVNSSSFSQFIGLALLANPHLPGVDIEKLADSIVHESIHSMLFMLEEVEAPFLLDRVSAKIMVTSPWSGNVINLHAYLHACLVWYSLYWLWHHAASTGEFSAERCKALQEKARSGFLHQPSQLIAQYHELCAPQIVSYLRMAESIMEAADEQSDAAYAAPVPIAPIINRFAQAKVG
jgi:hypothetical protein